MSEMNAAIARLDSALSRLEQAFDAAREQTGDPSLLRRELAAMVHDRDALADALDESKARELELEALAAEASEALGSAIAEVRAALGREGTGV
ncbi:MAG: DUF4164 family protein [Pseudomonadota bacterium]